MKYKVYFMDGRKKSVPESDISECYPNSVRRIDMMNKDFFYDGLDNNGVKDMSEGRFRVRQLLGRQNEYKCVRISGGELREQGQILNFDIGFVIHAHADETQSNRERGFGEVLSTRRHR